MYIPKYFKIQELVPPELFEQYKQDPTILFRLFGADVLMTLDRLRIRYGPCVINTWHNGGNFKESGFRMWDTPTGAALSCHKLGKAMDCKFKNITPQEIWEEIKKNPNQKEFRYIKRVEAFPGMTWFHFDMGNFEGPGIHFIGKG